jgi:F-type H+-transporting ATPase subunit b
MHKESKIGERFKDCFILFLSIVLILIWSAVVFAAGGGEEGGHSTWADFDWRMFNFIVLVALLYMLTWKQIKNFFVGRRAAIQAALEEAVRAKEEAEAKFKEYSERLEKASSEIEGISEMIKAQGVVEKEKIIESAKKTAEKMKEDSRARMDQELKKAINQLRLEASVLAVQTAEEILSKTIKKEDHERMVKETIDRMVKLN